MALGSPTYLVLAGGLIALAAVGVATYAMHSHVASPDAISDDLGAANAPIVTADTPCVSVLSPGANAFVVNNGAAVHAPACILAVKSRAVPAAVLNTGTKIDTARLCIASDGITQNTRNLPSLSLDCPVAVPDTIKLSAPADDACDDHPQSMGGTDITMEPGIYCGGMAFNAAASHVTFSPGVYVIKGGDWTVDGGAWSGNGVTFYFADASKIQFNSGVSIDLRAPQAGPYRNLLMFEAPGLAPSPFIFNDARAMHLDGVVWLPSRDMTFNSGSKLDSGGLMMGVHALTLDQTDWTIAPLR